MSDLLATIVDTLLPGEAPMADQPAPLPAGTAAGIDMDKYRAGFQALLHAIAQAAGSGEAFLAASEAARVEILLLVQRAQPDDFAKLLGALLPDYYESAAVLAALGWRSTPPQPLGNDVAPMAEDVGRMLERVSQRGQRWRG